MAFDGKPVCRKIYRATHSIIATCQEVFHGLRWGTGVQKNLSRDSFNHRDLTGGFSWPLIWNRFTGKSLEN